MHASTPENSPTTRSHPALSHRRQDILRHGQRQQPVKSKERQLCVFQHKRPRPPLQRQNPAYTTRNKEKLHTRLRCTQTLPHRTKALHGRNTHRRNRKDTHRRQLRMVSQRPVGQTLQDTDINNGTNKSNTPQTAAPIRQDNPLS